MRYAGEQMGSGGESAGVAGALERIFLFRLLLLAFHKMIINETMAIDR
jgi:hypothetical protein